MQPDPHLPDQNLVFLENFPDAPPEIQLRAAYRERAHLIAAIAERNRNRNTD